MRRVGVGPETKTDSQRLGMKSAMVFSFAVSMEEGGRGSVEG
jgi:hypothetical protein